MANPVNLEDFRMLLFTKRGEQVSVSTFGAVYSEPPRCCDAVDAACAWVAGAPRDQLGIETTMNDARDADGITQLLALIEAFGSSSFMRGTTPEEVPVPGQGRWVFIPD
jgi:hypothetical protein